MSEKNQKPYRLANGTLDYFISDGFKREVACFAAEGIGIIAMSSQDRMALVEFDFFKIWEAMKVAPKMPQYAWMIHTHPPVCYEKSSEDTNSVKGWVTALGMPIEMVIVSELGNTHYRCNKDKTIFRRGVRYDSKSEQFFTEVMRGISVSDVCPTQDDFDKIVVEANGLLPLSMWNMVQDSEYTGELFEADPNCKHLIEDSHGGGVNCTNCTGWFGYW